MTSPPDSTAIISSSTRPTDTSPPKKSNLRNRYYNPNNEDKNMTTTTATSIPINIPRMPPSNPSSSSSSSHRPHPHRGESYERLPPHPHSQSYAHLHSSSSRERERERETRGESPSSGRSPTISHSYNRSHPYPRRRSFNSQPERERERDMESTGEREQQQLPRIHLPPPISIAPLKFSNESGSGGNNHQLSPIEREFPSLSTSSQRDTPPPSSWRSGGSASEPRAQIHRIPSGGSVGKSAGISLPPLHSISGSPTLPPPIGNMPPPSSVDNNASSASGSASTARTSPRLYPPNLGRPSYSPYEPPLGHPSSKRSPSSGVSKLRERERDTERSLEYEQQQHQAIHSQARQPPPYEKYQTHEPSREELYELHRRSSSQSTVPLPNQSSSLPLSNHHHHHQQQHQMQYPHHHHQIQGYDMPSPPLRALPPSAMPPMPYVSPYGHRGGGGGTHLARSRSQSATSGYGIRPGLEGEQGGMGNVAPTPGQSRRLAHLMSEQKRRESINSGFQALRQALPSSLPTDSKAIILRKAVSHITYLEDLVRRSGIDFSNSPPNLGPPNLPGGGPLIHHSHPSGGPSDRNLMNDRWSNSNEDRERDRDSLDEDDSSVQRVKWEEDR
ncbi:uncharacterized protein L201_007138 [Kwoniella dendrophila CBS 6074]|uniref:BHLH domain-containing protein n=1 Tax=Kwoniella dendrophila CBS 6074 TaxID=1295534 RepID=A0AAX4K4X9_9TREE